MAGSDAFGSKVSCFPRGARIETVADNNQGKNYAGPVGIHRVSVAYSSKSEQPYQGHGDDSDDADCSHGYRDGNYRSQLVGTCPYRP